MTSTAMAFNIKCEGVAAYWVFGPAQIFRFA